MNQLEDSQFKDSFPKSLKDWELKAWKRLSAGMLVEQGLGDKATAKRWQEHVKVGDFDPDRCAEEILQLGSTKSSETESKLLLRAARLERDLLMTPLLRGASGAKRKVRGAARTGLAMGISQLMVLAICCGLIFLLLLVLAYRGVEFDPFFGSLIDLIPAMPKSDS